MMENPESIVDINKNSSESIKSVDPQNAASTSRYGRARKPKSFFQDFYNTDEVVKNPQKRGMKSLSPKSKKTKASVSDDFVHVTGDVDDAPEPVVKPIAVTTEDSFDNFMKSVQNIKPAETSIKERKFFKSTQESKLQASTISYISKVVPKQATKVVDVSIDERIEANDEIIEPELDVNKVIKIVTKSTDIAVQLTDSQKSQKSTVKTYGNKRKVVQKPEVFETFGLPDKPFIEPTSKDATKITKITKTSEIDVVINTDDKNQINVDTKNCGATTFFGIKLSPEKPRDLASELESPSKVLAIQNKATSKLITSVTRIGKVQPSVTKIKSVLSSDDTKKIFSSVSKQNIITIVPKNTSKVASNEGQASKVLELPKEQLFSPMKSPTIQETVEAATDIPTCKIKSITSVSDPKNVNNNNQEKKFVKVVMDNSKILKVLPTSGGSPVKLNESGNTSGESDKSDSIASPPYSPIKSKLIPIPTVTLPNIINISTSSKISTFTSSTSTPKLTTDSNKTSPKIIASSSIIRREIISPVSPVKVINFPSKDCSISPVKVTNLSSPIKTVNVSPKDCSSPTKSPKMSPIIGRKRKQDLILRKETDHSYSIAPLNRSILAISPKKKFMARLKNEVAAPKVASQPEKEIHTIVIDNKIEEIKEPIKEDNISVVLSKETSKIVEELELELIKLQEKVPLPEILKETEKSKPVLEATAKTIKTKIDSPKSVELSSFSDRNISPVVRLKQLNLAENNQLTNSREATPELLNKPIEAVSKNIVRVSPRKGKGMNAFLWENNSGAFFIKQTVKNKTPEVQIKEECNEDDEELINESGITVVDEEKSTFIKDEVIGEDMDVINSSPVKEEVNVEDIVKKMKILPIVKKPKEKISLNKEILNIKTTKKIVNKAKEATKIDAKTTKAVVIRPKKNVVTKKRLVNHQNQPGRQLRTRKFIFAEQITSTNRKTIAKILDKTPKPSKENVSISKTRFRKNNELAKKKSEKEMLRQVEIKQENIDNEEGKLVTENVKKLDKKSKSTKSKPNLILNKSAVRKTSIEKVVEVKKSARLRNSIKKKDLLTSEDVILIPTLKKVIEIDSDDEPLVELLQGNEAKEKTVDPDFVLIGAEIKKEIVTPEKRSVMATRNVEKRKRPIERPRKMERHIRKLKMLHDNLQEDVVIKNVKKRIIPLPIHSESKMLRGKIDLAVKEEKIDVKYNRDDFLKEEIIIDEKIPIKKEKTSKSSKYIEGAMVWAKVGCHPYWPAMITKDPTKNVIKQTIISSKLNANPYYHVRYFADNGRRSWVRATALMLYKRKDDLDRMIKNAPASNVKRFKVPTSKYALWKIAVDELESIKSSTLSEKLNFFIKASLRSAKKKKGLALRLRGIKREKPGLDFDDSPSNVNYKTLSSTRKIPIPIPEIKTPTTSRPRLHSVDTLNRDSPRSHIDRFLQSQMEDKISWKKLRSRSMDDDRSQLKLENDIQRFKDFDTTDCSSSETDSMHHKILPSGPIPCSIEYQELLVKRNNLFRKVSRDKVCEICFKPNNVLSCKGPCSGFYHLDCANGYLDDSSNKISECLSIKLSTKSYKRTNLSRLRKNKTIKSESNSGNSSDADSKKSLKGRKNQKNNINTFICGSCDRNDHYECFVCCNEVSPTGDQVITKCNVAKCGKAYHRDCTRLWPQVQWLDKPANAADPKSPIITSVICPRHVCHICVSDDPKAASARADRSEALVRCLMCPATYHSVTACIPAGTEIYTSSQVVCPRHLTLPNHSGILSSSSSNALDQGSASTSALQDYYSKALATINTNWCFICSAGGNLVCCERCPTSVHEACSLINMMDDDTYICEDCETGRLILYDEVVWTKLGSYRWWPALVLYPKDIPANVRNMRHRRGEFVIKFFGSYDHYWMGQCRSFLYNEGDKASTAARRMKRMDIAFSKALDEAAKAFVLKRDFKNSKLQSGSRQPKSLKPPAYVKIRCNKPVGNVKVYDGNVSITTPCSCDATSEAPCGPNTYCINRLLWTECNPRNCPAGERCENQQFETRQYPLLVPYKTDGRGWGLKTLVPLAAGQFVIEYVGEVIEELEYKTRVANMQKQAQVNFYFLTIDGDRIIDAGPKGNVARFMNHCCEPNCETQKWKVNGDTRVGLFACENIPANTELTFNYNLAPNGKSLMECKCKAPTCSGFIGVKKTIDNPKSKISEKLQLKKKKRIAKSAKQRNKNLQHKICFICGKDGKLITCSIFACSESYHIECVKLMSVPYAFWRCPRHYCNICSQKIVKRCKLCINSYCSQHCSKKTEGKIIEFLCPEHKKNDPLKIKEETDIKKDIVIDKNSEKTIVNRKDEPKTVSVVPKEEKVEVDKKNIPSKRKVITEKILKKKKMSLRSKNTKKQNNQINIKLASKRQLRRSR